MTKEVFINYINNKISWYKEGEDKFETKKLNDVFKNFGRLLGESISTYSLKKWTTY